MTTSVRLCSPMLLSALRSVFSSIFSTLRPVLRGHSAPPTFHPHTRFISATTPYFRSAALIYATQFPIPLSFQDSPDAPVLHMAPSQHLLVLHAFHLSFLYCVFRSAHLPDSLFGGKLCLPNALPDIYT